jgi:hypothetical protein
MKTTHTPGPWEVKPEEVGRQYIRVRATVAGSRFKIANVLCPAYGDGYTPPDKTVEADQRETRANARLIAAAPELLEALRRCKFDSLNMSFADLEFCRAAIAAATGAV